MAEKIKCYWLKTKFEILLFAVALFSGTAGFAGAYCIAAGKIAEAEQEAEQAKDWAVALEDQFAELAQEFENAARR